MQCVLADVAGCGGVVEDPGENAGDSGLGGLVLIFGGAILVLDSFGLRSIVVFLDVGQTATFGVSLCGQQITMEAMHLSNVSDINTDLDVKVGEKCHEHD